MVSSLEPMFLCSKSHGERTRSLATGLSASRIFVWPIEGRLKPRKCPLGNTAVNPDLEADPRGPCDQDQPELQGSSWLLSGAALREGKRRRAERRGQQFKQLLKSSNKGILFEVKQQNYNP